MKRKNFDNDDDDMVYNIQDIVRFKTDIKNKVWENFTDRLEGKMVTDDEELQSFLVSGDPIEYGLAEEVFDYEINKFIILDDYDDNRGCIVKRDIFKLINRLTNEIIGNHLNRLVEKGYLVMCWDNQYDEFIWRPTKKE